MARYYALIAVLCITLALLVVWSTGVHSALYLTRDDGPSPGLPVLRIEQERQDLGTIAAGKPVQAVFSVSNEGSRRLVIRRESGRCCGQSGPEDITLIPPGGKAKLVIEVDPTGIRGGLQQEISYATNDPRMPHFRLTVVGRVAGDGKQQ